MKNIKLSIAQKLFTGFGVILLFIVINGIWTYATLTTSKNLNHKLTGTFSPSAEELNHLSTMITDSKMLIRSWVFIDKQSGTPDKVKLESLQSKDYPELRDGIKSYFGGWDDADVKLADSIFNDIDRLFVLEKYIMDNLNSFEAYEDAMVLFDVEPQVQEGGEVIVLADDLTSRIEELASEYLLKVMQRS